MHNDIRGAGSNYFYRSVSWQITYECRQGWNGVLTAHGAQGFASNLFLPAYNSSVSESGTSANAVSIVYSEPNYWLYSLPNCQVNLVLHKELSCSCCCQSPQINVMSHLVLFSILLTGSKSTKASNTLQYKLPGVGNQLATNWLANQSDIA